MLPVAAILSLAVVFDVVAFLVSICCCPSTAANSILEMSKITTIRPQRHRGHLLSHNFSPLLLYLAFHSRDARLKPQSFRIVYLRASDNGSPGPMPIESIPTLWPPA